MLMHQQNVISDRAIKKFVYVPRMLLYTFGSEVSNTPPNHGLVFVKGKDKFLTSDYWRIIVNLDLTAYEDGTSTLVRICLKWKKLSNVLFLLGN